MPLILNRKSSRVGLPLKPMEKDGPLETMFFAPGTHEYDEENLVRLQMERVAVRAYWEPQGTMPSVLEDVSVTAVADPLPTEKKSAADMKEEIAKSSDPEWLRRVLSEDGRTTVMFAADKRLAELQLEGEPPVDPSAPTDNDPPVAPPD